MPIYDTVKFGRENQGVEKDKPRLKKFFLDFLKKRGVCIIICYIPGSTIKVDFLRRCYRRQKALFGANGFNRIF